MNQPSPHFRFDTSIPNEQLVEIVIDEIDSPALSRLIEEVRNDSESTVYNYDRVHNRHNR
ncbi:MAG: YhhA family cyclophane-containing RiPP [Nitrosomonas sp.]|nr:YhhA family cyclophane-containing RiPP [Nitrosomonas sp.]MDP1949739.1 YhhA family cyclophane-containing RiPP [Nitrosomonas sp.]